MAAALALLAPAAPAQAGDSKTLVFKPARTSQKVVTFRLHGVKPQRVLRASLVRHGKVRRRVTAAAAQRAARRGVLRVRVRSSRAHRRMGRFVGNVAFRRARGTLWVRRVARTSVKLRVVSDTRAPRTSITAGPDAVTESTSAAFRFRSDERKSTFECRVDAGAWRSCVSPTSLTDVSAGGHTFSVRAKDRAGNVDGTPATRDWMVAVAAAGTTEPVAPPVEETAVEPAPAETTAEDPAVVPTPDAGETVPAPAEALLFDSFTGLDGVITNHYAFWSDDATAARSDVWEMESGCALRRDNTLWSGVPTSNIPNKDCSNGSGSETFRLWSKSSFGNARVSFSLRNNGYVVGSQGERTWDGIKIWLRRQGGTGSVGLYTAEVHRRQGNIMIQKKCAGSSEYHILSQARPEGSEASIGTWENVGGVVETLPDGSVRLALIRHGRTVLEATDSGVACAPITSPGRVGIRGDSTDFNVDDFLVAPAV